MYYDMDNMNDIDVRSSNNFLRKVFLYMVLGVAISFGTGIYLYLYNQELLFSLARYFNIMGIAGLGMVLILNFFLEKNVSRNGKNTIYSIFTCDRNNF